MRTLAIIPARGGSKRLPGKNLKLLFNKPLIAWTIEFAKSVPWFDEIQVSTDSQEIAAVCEQYGVTVSRLRPAELATDESSSLDVVLDVLQWRQSSGGEFDAIALLQPTTPVRFLERWMAAHNLLEQKYCEGVIGVSPVNTHPYLVYRESGDGLLVPWDERAKTITRSQDFPPAHEINGALYWIMVRALLEQQTFVPKRCCYVSCSNSVENIDIDTDFDWRLAEMLIADEMKINAGLELSGLN